MSTIPTRISGRRGTPETPDTMKRIFIILALILVAGLAMAQRQANWYSLMQIAATPTAQVTWTDSYSNNRAFYFNGDTNASGYAIDHSFNFRHATNGGGIVESVPVGTNVNGRVQYALKFDGFQSMIIGGETTNQNFFLGYSGGPFPLTTSVVCYAWVMVTNRINNSKVIWHNDVNFYWGVSEAIAANNYYVAFAQTANAPLAVGSAPASEWHFVAIYWNAAGDYKVRISLDAAGDVISATTAGGVAGAFWQFGKPIVIGQDQASSLRFMYGYVSTIMMLTNCIPPPSYETNFCIKTDPRNNISY